MRSGRGTWKRPGGAERVNAATRRGDIDGTAKQELAPGGTAMSGGGTFPAGGISSSWPQACVPTVSDGPSERGVP